MSFRYTAETETVSKVYFDELYVGTVSKRDDGLFYAVASGGKQLPPEDSMGKAQDRLAVFHVWRTWPEPVPADKCLPNKDGMYLVWANNGNEWQWCDFEAGAFRYQNDDGTVDLTEDGISEDVKHWLPFPPKPGAIFKQ